MQSLGKLDLLALLLQQFIPRINTRTFYGEFVGDEKWGEEDGIRFCDFSSQVALVASSLGVPSIELQTVLDRAEFECLQIQDNLRPHYHNNSASVIFCPNDGYTSDFEGYFQLGKEHGIWAPLYGGQIIQIPRRVPHGFQRIKGTEGGPLVLVAATLGRITPQDTFYL